LLAVLAFLTRSAFYATHIVVENLCQCSGFKLSENHTFVQEIKLFVDQYCALREVEKKMLKESDLPYSALHLRQNVLQNASQKVPNSTVRYTGGAKERARERMDNGMADDRDKAILEGHLCAFCGGSLSTASKVTGVESTYCSRECTYEGRLKRGGMYSSSRIREQVFALEGGVCCLCGINAHALFTRIVGLEPAERLNALCNSNWKLPITARALERLLQNPKEGDFWQADHIIPVAEGGGGCGLENLRTLCVPCHLGKE
jgi:5-methylcytosine-specific restriction endonuclease McrA